MAVDEVRIRLRRKLEEMLGVDEADLLMDRPPGGWSDLVTKADLDRTLDLRLAALKHELTSTFHEEMVAQTWRFVTATGALFATFTGLFALIIKL